MRASLLESRDRWYLGYGHYKMSYLESCLSCSLLVVALADYLPLDLSPDCPHHILTIRKRFMEPRLLALKLGVRVPLRCALESYYQRDWKLCFLSRWRHQTYLQAINWFGASFCPFKTLTNQHFQWSSRKIYLHRQLSFALAHLHLLFVCSALVPTSEN